MANSQLFRSPPPDWLAINAASVATPSFTTTSVVATEVNATNITATGQIASPAAPLGFAQNGFWGVVRSFLVATGGDVQTAVGLAVPFLTAQSIKSGMGYYTTDGGVIIPPNYLPAVGGSLRIKSAWRITSLLTANAVTSTITIGNDVYGAAVAVPTGPNQLITTDITVVFSAGGVGFVTIAVSSLSITTLNTGYRTEQFSPDTSLFIGLNLVQGAAGTFVHFLTTIDAV
jgi:hypothetical protein